MNIQYITNKPQPNDDTEVVELYLRQCNEGVVVLEAALPDGQVNVLIKFRPDGRALLPPLTGDFKSIFGLELGDKV